MKVRTMWEKSEDFIPEAEINDGISLTVPDMSLSVQEILSRFRRGTLDPDTLYRGGVDTEDDFDDDYLDNVDDLVDVYNLKNHLNEQISKNLRNGSDSPAVGFNSPAPVQEQPDTATE